MDLDERRAQLQSHGLGEREVDADPGIQFGRWFDEAVEAGMREPEAMIVSTATPDGIPSSRHVLLRDWAGGTLTFFTNYESQKGRELKANPMIAACFPWNVLGRQVRVAGHAERTSPQASDAYFASRARDSQIGAWASAQSSVLAGRGELEAEVAVVEARFDGVDVPRPPYWGGYRIVPVEWEFWQGRPSRLHDRIRYRRSEGPTAAWVVERLSP